MNYEDPSIVLVFGLIGSATIFIGFLSAIMANIRYALISSSAGAFVGGLIYFFFSHMTLSYMIGGIITLISGVSFSVYYWTIKLDLLDYIRHEDKSISSKKRTGNNDEIVQVSGSWK